jgi:hypothetical protein
MSALPKCPNFVKRRGCERSDLTLIGENEEGWTFRCGTCELIWVCSKPKSIQHGKLRNQEEQLRKQAEARRAREKAPKYFT